MKFERRFETYRRLGLRHGLHLHGLVLLHAHRHHLPAHRLLHSILLLLLHLRHALELPSGHRTLLAARKVWLLHAKAADRRRHCGAAPIGLRRCHHTRIRLLLLLLLRLVRLLHLLLLLAVLMMLRLHLTERLI